MGYGQVTERPFFPPAIDSTMVIIKAWDKHEGKYCVDVLIDADMLEKASKYDWTLEATGYIRSSAGLLHRYLFGTDVPEYDHLNRNKLDNRRVNVVPTTRSNNMLNTGNFRNNTSGRKGVIWCKESKKWKAQIKLHQWQISLGRFENFEDAVACREKAEQGIANGTF